VESDGGVFPIQRMNSGNGYDVKSQKSSSRKMSGRVGGFTGMHPDTKAEIEKLIS
jgi:hypothetical protein